MRRREFCVTGVSAAVAGTAISCGESRGRGSWRFFTEREALVVEATCAQLIPTDRDPGAREAGVVHYIDIQLAKRLRKHQAAYRKGIAALDAGSRSKFGKGFVELTADQQVEALNALEENSGAFFDVLLAQTRQGFYGNPRHGGNRDIMRARQATRTAQQGCGAVAVGQLDTEDEPDVGSFQPLFLRCQTLRGRSDSRWPATLRSTEAPRRHWPSSGFQIRVKGAGEQIADQLAVIQRARPKSGKFKDALNTAQSRLEVGD